MSRASVGLDPAQKHELLETKIIAGHLGTGCHRTYAREAYITPQVPSPGAWRLRAGVQPRSKGAEVQGGKTCFSAESYGTREEKIHT